MSANLEHFGLGSVDRAEVLRYLGYAGQKMDPGLDARIDEVVDRCLGIARPAATWRVFDVASAGEREDGAFAVTLEGAALELVGESMREHLASAVAVGVMAVTTGLGIDRELRRLATVSPADQVIFDAAATTAVERAADACEAGLVAAAAERGLHTGFRFSPGYGDLPLETQPVLLDTVDARRRLGITMNPATFLMTPTKSVTAVIGMYEQPQTAGHASCKDCLCRDFCHIRATGTPCWAR